MKFIPWYRKACKKARHRKSIGRVASWTASCDEGKLIYYTTMNGTRHNIKNGWKLLENESWDEKVVTG